MAEFYSKHGPHKLRISVGHKNLGRVKNKTVTWTQLLQAASTPQHDVQYTLEQYKNLSLTMQSELKNVGFFVGGHCDDGVRRITNVRERWVLTLDVDECSPAHVADIEWGLSGISDFEFYSYSTRKHTRENPRLRILIPLARPVDAEAYHALSRIVGEMFDVTMKAIDPVSFRATQLMYWPSVCKDAEFFSFHNPGILLDPVEVLKNFGDWEDHTKLPRSERDSSNFSAAGRKPEDPTKKSGVVGAFCRVYDVPAAIEEFLPDLYVDPVETPQGLRYTYAKGTTSHGAIVYDDGKFLYSNHMHDPAAGHSQNAFDLVRIHLYGDADARVKEGTTPMNLPSSKAFIARLKEDEAVSSALRDENYDFDQATRQDLDDEDTFEALDAPKSDVVEGDLDDEPEEIKSTKWLDRLDLNSDGIIKATMHNIVLILLNDVRFAGCIRRNLFNYRKVYYRELDFKAFGDLEIPVTDRINGSEWTDAHDRFVKLMLESPRGKNKPGYGLRANIQDLRDAIEHAADRRSVHPVRVYLESVKWDGKPRMENLFIDYLGADDSKRFKKYHQTTARLTLLAAVPSIYEPGHKFDFMPVLEGVQGKRKSSFVAGLSKGLWFREMGDIGDKNKTVETMTGAWILEWAELQQFGRAEIQQIKAFLSSAGETTRLAYARNTSTFLRQCIFIGTTNDTEYLRDPTGGRRFWPVACTVREIDTDKLAKNIDQIWAEALTMYRQLREENPDGVLPLYITDEETDKVAKWLQESRRQITNEETLADQIETWLEQPVPVAEAEGRVAEKDSDTWDDDGQLVYRHTVCSAEIYEKVMGYDRKRIATDRLNQNLISKAMHFVAGWTRHPDANARYGEYGKQRVLYKRDVPKKWPPVPDDDDI